MVWYDVKIYQSNPDMTEFFPINIVNLKKELCRVAWWKRWVYIYFPSKYTCRFDVLYKLISSARSSLNFQPGERSFKREEKFNKINTLTIIIYQWDDWYYLQSQKDVTSRLNKKVDSRRTSGKCSFDSCERSVFLANFKFKSNCIQQYVMPITCSVCVTEFGNRRCGRTWLLEKSRIR